MERLVTSEVIMREVRRVEGISFPQKICVVRRKLEYLGNGVIRHSSIEYKGPHDIVLCQEGPCVSSMLPRNGQVEREW